MTRKSSRRVGPFTKTFAVLAVIGAIMASGIIAYNADELYLAGKGNALAYLSSRIVAGSRATVLVATSDTSGRPISTDFRVDVVSSDGARIVVNGKTGADGWGEAAFDSPSAPGDANVYINSSMGTVEKCVTIDDTIRVLLATDKPIYQPGQVVRIRVAAFEGDSPHPSGRNCTFEVRSPYGDAIFRKTVALDEFGIGSLDYPLGYVLPFGSYKINVTIGSRVESSVFVVKNYVLPMFAIQLLGIKDWYTVGDSISGAVSAAYTFGKQVPGYAEVTAKAYVGIWSEVGRASGSLVNGSYSFHLPSVQYAAGVLLNGGNGYIEINSTVTDTSGHSEKRSTIVPLASGALSVNVLAESNMVGERSSYLFLVRTPDGKPVGGANVSVTIGHLGPEAYKTDGRGVAKIEFTYHGEAAMYYSVNNGGTSASGTIALGARSYGLKVIPDKRGYRLGEQMKFDVVYSGSSYTSTLYYEVIARDFVLSSGRVALSSGRGQIAIAASQSMSPAAEVRVYKIQTNLSVISDSTIVAVGGAECLDVRISADKGEYKPRDAVRLTFNVSKDGSPEIAAVGVSGVDSAVYELAGRMTGFESLFYDLESDFLQPRWQICNYAYGEGADPGIDPGNRTVVNVSSSKGLSLTGMSVDHLAKAAQARNGAVEMFNNAILVLALVGAFIGIVALARYKGPKAIIAVVLIVGIGTSGLSILYVMTSGYMSGGGGSQMMGIDSSQSGGGNDGSNSMPAPATGIGLPTFSLEDTSTGRMDVGTQLQIAPPPVTRQYFPETWIWVPSLVTGRDGSAHLDVEAPDSITKWEISAIATTKDGSVGTAQGNLTVFQEFFVEPDIPVSAVRGDEFPLRVMIYNYLRTPMNVSVVLQGDSWFDSLDGASRMVGVSGESVTGVTFRIRPQLVGRHNVTILAGNMQTSDMVVREMRVEPNGKLRTVTQNAVLDDNASAALRADAFQSLVPGSQGAVLRIEAGLLALTLDGAGDFIQFVSGCGEQSTSRLSVDVAAYKNLLMSDVSDEQMAKYETILTQGIQHELIYLMAPADAPGRAICWHNGEPADLWLTAWALFAFQDLRDAGFEVDTAIVSDMQRFILSQQSSDGHFGFPNVGHWSINDELQGKDLAATAYIVRGLLYSGMVASSEGISRAVSYMASHASEAGNSAYTTALLLLSLRSANAEPALQESLADKLSAMKTVGANDSASWTSTSRYTDTTTETTAYVAMALSRFPGHSAESQQALKHLLKSRNHGYFGSTHDTAVAFQALNVCGSFGDVQMTVAVTAPGGFIANESFTQATSDMPRVIDLAPWISASGVAVDLKSTGVGRIMAQLIYEEYVPWSEIVAVEEAIALTVSYDATNIRVDDMVRCTVSLAYTGPAPMLKMVLVDLRAPVGFSFVVEDFDGLLANGTINQYEVSDRQAVVYIDGVQRGVPMGFVYRIRADMPIRATVQGVRAYDMYNPGTIATLPPVEFVSTSP
ncbi:MAG: hypothetical protein HZB92_04625 [Euryarchaeota archaeon]|nr:hypothetical protein [Euryarchaeota archaeon]